MDIDNMDNDTALKLLKEGCMFVFLNTPKGMEFGIDMKTWTTAEKFRGVKMIPPGPHFIYFSPRNVHGDTAPRSGFFHVFKRKEILVKIWDSDKEELSNDGPSEADQDHLRENILEIDQYLGPYPFDIYAKWKTLSKNINENVVKKLTPESGCIKSAVDLVRIEKSKDSLTKRRWSKSRTDEERQEDLLPELVPVAGSQIRFTEMPLRRYPEGSSPAEISSHYIDSSYALNAMLSNYSNPVEFVGEVQFAFVCFLLGLNLEALEQWKKLVQLLCNCTKALKRYTHMYSELIACLDVHLDEINEDFLVDIVANDNIIYRSLRHLFGTIEMLRNEIDGRLYCKCDNFHRKLTKKYGWNFSDLLNEEDDEAPVVVEL